MRAREHNSKADIFDLWFHSGLLAQFLIRPALCNLAVAFLAVAEPLCFYGGQYELPPNISIDPADEQRSLRDWRQLLKERGVKNSCLWSVTVIVLLFSLVRGARESTGDSSPAEKLFGSGLVGAAAVILGLTAKKYCFGTAADQSGNKTTSEVELPLAAPLGAVI